MKMTEIKISKQAGIHKKAQELIDYVNKNLPDSYIKIEVDFKVKNFSDPKKLVSIGNFTMEHNQKEVEWGL